MKDKKTIEALLANVENAVQEVRAKLIEDGVIEAATASARIPVPDGPTPPN